MKKIISNILFAALVIATAASCQMELDIESQAETNGSRVLVASFDQTITRTTLGDDHLTPKWAEGDVIKLTDGTNAQNFTLVNSTAGDNQAQITNDGANFTVTIPGSWGTTIYGCYPASAFDKISEEAVAINIPSSQDGSFASANICTAKTTGSTLAFQNATALLKFTTEETTKAVNIAISGASSITLTPSSAGVNYVAVPAGKPFKNFTFTAIKTATNWAAKTSTSESETVINKIYDLGAVSGWTYNDDGNTLWGQFTVKDGKKVRFSKGNLWCNTSTSPLTWAFEANQYDFRTKPGYDACINGSYATGTTPSNNIGHFSWSKDASKAVNGSVDGSYSSSDVFFANSDASVMGSNWVALSVDEVGYLFATRSASTAYGTADARFSNVQIGDVKGLVLFPDCFVQPSDVTLNGVNDGTTTEIDVAAWQKLELAGAVFLPNAGQSGNGGAVGNVGGRGRYWTSSCSSGYYNMPYYEINWGGSPYKSANVNRGYCYSIRLVTE